MNNINIKQDDDAGQNSATVGRLSYFAFCRSTIAAASYTVLRTLMVLLLTCRPRCGDDEEVSNHRRSRGLLAAGGFVVLAYLRNAHSQPKSANTCRIHNSIARSQCTYHHAQGIGMHLQLQEERIHAGALV